MIQVIRTLTLQSREYVEKKIAEAYHKGYNAGYQKGLRQNKGRKANDESAPLLPYPED